MLCLQAMSDAPFYVQWVDSLFPPGPKMSPMLDKVIWQGIMQGTFEDPEAAQQRYREWNEKVKQVCACVWMGGRESCIQSEQDAAAGVLLIVSKEHQEEAFGREH